MQNAIFFLGGMAGLAHETIIAQADRPALIGAFTMMLGLPFAVGSDNRRRRRGPPGSEETGDPDQEPPR